MSPATSTEDTIIAANPETDQAGATDDPQAGGLFSTGDSTILSGIDSSITENALAAKASADAAKASETNAAGSATNASTSATNASTSATNAATSATSAASDLASIGTSLTDAEAARDAAQTAQAAAETAETNAETAETNAETAETNANTFASTATTKAGEAASSATDASNSASTATTKASEAATSASTATTKANEAASSVTDAQTAQTAAELAETNAETAETNAETAETNASNSASAASTSASTATTKAGEASTSASNASTSASTATTKASEASTSATSASTSASTATTKASEASASATSASTSASTATTKASEASTSASNASTSESNASGSASTATTKASEAATSETQAASSATSANTSASTATTKASEAATSASNAATSETNAGTSETNASTSETNAGNSATSASTSATNASNSATSASGSASTATTKASEASTSASNASTSASTATTKASEASTSETNASNSATAASTSASNASNSATSAASAQTAAESARDATLAAYDNFDDRYLGVKSSDPSVDNDGNSLVAGALYFDSTSEAMKVYTGSAWVAAYVSGTGFAALTGATFTGNVTVPNLVTSGNVDGRDVSVDGSKLDGIASGATVPNNATITLAAGTNLSGGGNFTTDQSSNETITFNFSGTIPTATSDLTNDSGFITSADGGNAQTLDSLDSTSFLRSDVADTKTSGDLAFSDNVSAKFGTGNDLSLYHDGTDSYVTNKTGNLYIGANDPSDVGGNLYLRAKVGENDTSIVLNDDSGIIFYSNGAITMQSYSSFLYIYDNTTFQSSADLILNGGNLVFDTGTYNTTVTRTTATEARTLTLPDANGTVALTSDIPTSVSELTNDSGFITSADGGNAATLDSLDSTQFLRSDAADTKTSGDLTFSDNVKAAFGTGSDLQLYHDGTNSYIDQNDATLFIRNTSDTSNPSGNGIDIRNADNTGIEIPNNSGVTIKRSGNTSVAFAATGAFFATDIVLNGNTRELKFRDTSAGNFYLTLDAAQVTDSDKTITLPNSTGTVLLNTGDQTITGDLTLTSTDAGATGNPTLDLYRNSGSPADGDVLGNIDFSGENSASEKVVYAQINTDIDDVTDGAEDGKLEFAVISNGAQQNRLTMKGNGVTRFVNRDVALGQDIDLIFEGSTDNANETTLTVTNPTADRTITLPDASGTVLLKDANDDVIIEGTDGGSGADPTLVLYRNSASPAVFDGLGKIEFKGKNSSGADHTYFYLQAQASDETAGTEDGVLRFYHTVGGNPDRLVAEMGYSELTAYGRLKINASTTYSDPSLIFEGATTNSFETSVKVVDPTADRTITLPDATGTVLLTDGDGSNLTGISTTTTLESLTDTTITSISDNEVLIYDTSSGKWINQTFAEAGIPSGNATSNRVAYTATAGQTSFNATYTVGYVDVYLNGVKLIVGTDFTATTGSTVVLATGAALNDTVDIVGYGTFTLGAIDIVNDGSPQLGANLDLNSFNITGTGSIPAANLTGTLPAIDGSALTGISTDLVGDTTPQLGGDLDLNSNNITGTGAIPAANLTGTLPAIDGSALTGIAAGATGGGSDQIFYENGQTVTTNYTITNGKNAMSAGPITINTGVTVTVGTGEAWTVV